MAFQPLSTEPKVSPPSQDNGDPVVGYEASSDGGTHWTQLTVTGTTDLTAVLNGLVDGQTYGVMVRAV